MFRRTKAKFEKKDDKTEDSKPKSTKGELTAGFGKILGSKKNKDSDADFSKSNQIDTGESQVEKNEGGIEIEGENKDKVSKLISLIKSSKEKAVSPKLDLTTGDFTFPLLEQIGEKDTNVKFLENLTSSSSDVLEKTVYERIAVCPQHPDSLQANVRLYCPKCNSMDIEKLHLFEHRVCGYISETKSFGTNSALLTCPSCKKEIKDRKKELRIPAMWYNCLSCNEKFDDIVIKMYCRKFNHDFDTNMAGTVSIPCFKLKDAKLSSGYDSSLISHIKDLLKENGFISEENHSLKGRSGHYHNIDLIATNNKTDTIFTFVLNSGDEIAESEINAKTVQVLDCAPTKTVVIGKLSNKAKSIASRYHIDVIDSLEKDEVLSSFSKILVDGFESIGENERVGEKQKRAEKRLVERKILEEERLETEKIEAERLESEMLAEKQRLEEEMVAERKELEAERQADKQKLEAERERLEEERQDAERLEAERLAERKRLEEERKKVERIEAERIAERKKLESERIIERKRIESERQAERKKLEEERFADKLQLKAEKQRLEEERKKVEQLEAERERLEAERKNAERLDAERQESERKKLEDEKKQAAKRERILKKLEETENQLKSLKSSFDSEDEKEE